MYASNALNIGGATVLQASNTLDASSLTTAAVTIAGGASIAKTLLVGNAIGIATTSPGYNLDINGDINIGGTIYQNGQV